MNVTVQMVMRRACADVPIQLVDRQQDHGEQADAEHDQVEPPAPAGRRAWGRCSAAGRRFAPAKSGPWPSRCDHRHPGLRIATQGAPVYGRAPLAGYGSGFKVVRDLRIAVDIGGTFTDVVLEEGGKRLTRKLLTTPQRARGGGSRRRAADPGRCRARLRRHRRVRARHDARHQRHHRAQGRAHRADRHRGLPRRPRDRRRKPLRPVRHQHREAAAAGAARAALHGARAHGRARRACAWRSTRRRCARSRASSSAAGHRGVAVALHARLRQSRARAAHRARSWPRRCPASGVTLSSEVCPEVREYERTSTAIANAYVQPLMAGYLERLQTALAAAGLRRRDPPDDLGRRPHQPRDGAALPGAPGRIGPGRRRDPRGAVAAAARRGAGAQLRHGRHHRQDLPDRRRQAASRRARSRSTAPRAS